MHIGQDSSTAHRKIQTKENTLVSCRKMFLSYLLDLLTGFNPLLLFLVPISLLCPSYAYQSGNAQTPVFIGAGLYHCNTIIHYFTQNSRILCIGKDQSCQNTTLPKHLLPLFTFLSFECWYKQRYVHLFQQYSRNSIFYYYFYPSYS